MASTLWPCRDGLVDDPTACGDPDHCSPVYGCICVRDGYPEDHGCVAACHPRADIATMED